MRSRTLTNLIADVRGRADMRGSTFIPDADITEYINQSSTELWDLVVQARGQDYYEGKVSFTTLAGQSEYTFAAMGLLDFYQLIQMECDYAGMKQPMRPWMRQEHALLTWNPVQPGRVITLYYVPACPRLVNGVDTFDGVNGWEEYVIVDAAAKCLEKEDSDCGPLYKRKAEMRQRIMTMAPDRDAGQPEYMTSFRDVKNPFQVAPMPLYRLRGEKVEILEYWTAVTP